MSKTDKTQRYLARAVTALSIFANVLLGGKINQTLSATQYQRHRDGKYNLVWLVDRLFYWETDHCMNAWIKWQVIHRAIHRYSILGEVYFEEKKAENLK